jgi:indole-3-glycerol phosphate synthase
VQIPVLRKDFLIDEYQIWEAREAGADAILLIAECLDAAKLRDLFSLAVQLKMTPLVEIHAKGNLQAVLDLQPRLIGVNNRDLDTFTVDLSHVVRLRAEIPAEITVVGESGIATHADVKYLQENQIAAILVGESLMRQADLETAVRKLLGDL